MTAKSGDAAKGAAAVNAKPLGFQQHPVVHDQAADLAVLADDETQKRTLRGLCVFQSKHRWTSAPSGRCALRRLRSANGCEAATHLMPIRA